MLINTTICMAKNGVFAIVLLPVYTFFRVTSIAQIITKFSEGISEIFIFQPTLLFTVTMILICYHRSCSHICLPVCLSMCLYEGQSVCVTIWCFFSTWITNGTYFINFLSNSIDMHLTQCKLKREQTCQTQERTQPKPNINNWRLQCRQI